MSNMTPREELDLILSLVKKYNLPLSPILEYAINEKKEEYIEEKSVPFFDKVIDGIIEDAFDKQDNNNDNKVANIVLTRELIEAARTPNGGFTKSQLAALGISWPAPLDWIEEKVGSYITPQQLEEFNHIEYVDNKPSKSFSSNFFNGQKSHKGIPNRIRIYAVLNALDHFDVPSSPRDVARTVSRSAWGGIVQEDEVENIMKLLPDVEYVPLGKYILKSKKR